MFEYRFVFKVWEIEVFIDIDTDEYKFGKIRIYKNDFGEILKIQRISIYSPGFISRVDKTLWDIKWGGNRLGRRS